MSDSSSSPSLNDPIFAAFFRDFEAASHRDDVLRAYCERHPHLADEFRDLAGMGGMLGGSLADATPDEPLPDRLGDFVNLRRIAHGGMGEIYEAVQEPLNRRVAVKTIRGRDRHLTGVLHTRFLREQKVLVQLHHTHIVPIHAAGRAGELQFFAMPYIDGAALHHVVRTVLLNESSSPRTPTPSLAQLAAEAQSRLSHETNASEAEARANPDALGADDAPRPASEGPASTDSTMRLTTPLRIEVDRRPSTEPPSASSGNGKLVLSAEYLRSVARVVIDAAEAVQHAHEAGIIHRDLKPSNLMVDRSEHCWVLDFGLAGYLKTQANGEAQPNRNGDASRQRPGSKPAPDLGPEPPPVSGVLGTPDYMAPEQFQGRADTRTDVWGLGVILYELLTLHRPFRGQREIESADPPRPCDLVHRLPRDLEAICLKTMRKEPAQRFHSAQDLADDLKHWLKHEPVQARPARTPRRVFLWSRRNPGWAAALVVAALAVLALGAGGLISGDQIAAAAEARAAAETREALTQRREALIQQIERIRKTRHEVGWSRDLWDLVRQAAKLQHDDGRLQAQAATSLAGLDAIKRKSFNFPATALAFDRAGKRLFIGGKPMLRKAGEFPVRTWDRATDDLRTLDLRVPGQGLFAFRENASPLYLVSGQDEPMSLQLWDVSAPRVLQTFTLPDLGDLRFRAWTITPDGAHVAASAVAPTPDGADRLAVWEAATGRLLSTIPTQRVTDVALSPDGQFLAAGYHDGQARVWKVASSELVATLAASRNRINCLAFGPNPLRRVGETTRIAEGSWHLATGDAGGTATTWDLTRKVPVSYGREAADELYAVAHSPDGTTLASAGRYSIRLWDIATGRMLLSLPAGNYIRALTFAPDGKTLAGGVEAAFGSPDGVIVWDLEERRGIQTLRGLTSSIVKQVFSSDGRFVAALANDWQVGIWDRIDARLLRVLEVTPGEFLDNAALTFSPDGRSLALSGGHQTSLWDVASGRMLRAWSLPEALQEGLVNLGPDHLLLYRVETLSGKVGPYSDYSPREHPRVFRVRNLLGNDPLKPLVEITDFNLGVYRAVPSPEGSFFIIDGLGGSHERPLRAVRVYDGRTGRLFGAIPTKLTHQLDYGSIRIDPTGKTAAVLVEEPGGYLLLEMPSRAVLDRGSSIGLMGPGGARWIADTSSLPGQPPESSLFAAGRKDPLVRFLRDEVRIGQFSSDGRLTCGGLEDGRIQVVDFVEVQRRLAEFDLGW